ncbi:MAG: GNAT family N-acetyltransferase [Lawsonibacter sp.]|jgi:RimJ/RimL family protein N-acetyltransferase
MIRNAQPADWQDILEIYAIARRFMKKAGNPTQWGDSFPPHALLQDDIRLGHGFVCEINGRIQGVFAMIPGDDPTYQVIQGAWQNDFPYRAVHRVASRGEVKGIASQILTWCLEQWGNIRIDTHEDNLPMQHVLAKNGFTPCGRIWVEDGSPRIAYQKTLPEFIAKQTTIPTTNSI